MKKIQYICPTINVFKMITEGIMEGLSGTHTDYPPSTNPTAPDTPQPGGGGTSEELAKKHNFNAWSTWDD